MARTCEQIATASAFATTPEDPEIDQPAIDYVAAFVPNQTGQKFSPHVTIGLAMQPYLDEMLAKPSRFQTAPGSGPNPGFCATLCRHTRAF